MSAGDEAPTLPEAATLAGPREDQSVFTLIRAAEQVGSALWRSISEDSLTIAQFLVLSDLAEEPGSGLFDVADRLGMDRATMGPLVRRLEAGGLLRREPSRQDKRRLVLDLLSPARETLASAHSWLRQVDREFLAPVEEARRRRAIDLWAAMAGLTSGSTGANDRSAYLIVRSARRRQRKIWAEQVTSLWSSSQFAVLRAVEAAPGCDIRTAARVASVEESTAVRIVMRLVRTQFVLDLVNPDDRRKSSLVLTEGGVQEIQRVMVAADKAEAAFVASIDGADRALAVESLAAVARA